MASDVSPKTKEEEVQYCFGCGQLNPRGLKLRPRRDGDAVVASFTPLPEHQGFIETLHGGIIATMLDEVMAWALYFRRIWALTAKMEVRYHQPFALDSHLQVRAEIVRDKGRTLEVRGEVRATEGSGLAEASAVFVRLPEAKAREIEETYRPLLERFLNQ